MTNIWFFDRSEEFRGHKDGTNRCELVKSFGEEELASSLVRQLVQTAGEVVANCVPENVFRGLLGSEIFTSAGGDEDKFGFVVRERRGTKFVHWDIVVGVGERSGRLGP